VDNLTQAEYIARQRQEMVGIAEQMLTDKMGIIEGARRLVALSHGAEMSDEDFMVFRAIDSETDALPVGESRNHWNEEALKAKDKEASDYEEEVREIARQACEQLINSQITRQN
jgi:hypothetical protein